MLGLYRASWSLCARTVVRHLSIYVARKQTLEIAAWDHEQTIPLSRASFCIQKDKSKKAEICSVPEAKISLSL